MIRRLQRGFPFRSASAAAMVALSSAWASASDEPTGAHARVRLEASSPFATRGQELLVGVTFAMDPGWHIYWNGRNDSGTHPEIEWSIEPSTAKAGEIRWPAPERYIAPGDILDHVYHDRVALIVPVRVPSGASGTLRLSAKLSYLICKDMCVAETAEAVLEVPIGADSTAAESKPAGSKPAGSSEAAQILRASLARLPKSESEGASVVKVEWAAGTISVRVEGAQKLRFFPDTACVELENIIHDGEVSGDRLDLRLSRTNDAESGGVDVLSGVVEIAGANGRNEWYSVKSERPAASPASGSGK